eukprot:NODE_1682_length_790_cov_258.140351_g1308_i0.p3 GENE.NODE_1682_length_790_cov_258.140351_g1308_i0~~NODE_1682_length_790_cov_258.140351_g1308_i0.p3  ORF type:complete len:90 (-),score=14.81 NODE_1682_length_790_cov_258.140351_g1308_i0:397-666(-)
MGSCCSDQNATQPADASAASPSPEEEVSNVEATDLDTQGNSSSANGGEGASSHSKSEETPIDKIQPVQHDQPKFVSRRPPPITTQFPRK